MLKLQRPEEPEEFQGAVRQAKEFVNASTRSSEMPEAWRNFLDVFRTKLHRKCGYCEVGTEAVFGGELDHFRPKGTYWWLAYDWSNYVLSCKTCNTNKGQKFPLKEKVTPITPGCEENETPLLLNPFRE